MTARKEVVRTMKMIGEETQRKITDAMPGSGKQISEKTGINRRTVDGIIRQLVRAGEVFVDRIEYGNTKAVRISFYDEVGRLDRKPVVVPVTAFKTQWLGGAHPCEVANPWVRMAA